MKWKDKLKFVRQNVKKNRMRTFMTVLATAMSCAFLIIIASVGFGVQKTVVDELTADALVTEIDIHSRIDSDFGQITLADIQYFESLDHVKAVTRSNFTGLTMEDDDDTTSDASIFGEITAMEALKQSGKLELAYGKYPEKENEVVVGAHFSDVFSERAFRNIEDTQQWLDKTINIMVTGESTTMEVKIVGIIEEPKKEWVSSEQIVIDELLLLNHGVSLGDSQQYDNVKVYMDHVKYVEETNKAISEAGYFTYAVISEIEQFSSFFFIFQAGLIFVGVIAIIIASIGIYNTMTMAVTERIQDIGIMKAIGSHPSTIRQLFLIESAYIGFIGAIIGTSVSYLLSKMVNVAMPVLLELAIERQPPEDFIFSYIPLSLVIIAVTICIGIAIISGIRPAMRATRVDVLKALRRDI
ncbi:ABC transporter permease [Longirhabdus pacifica]|uniref:ABC transporter permease n=1 Tax=Longirhabdus pacifica TaxID=2305227 RepID=UPI001008D740|nr:ABC transporter permease [Longirhabdus pacifica]